MTLSDEDRAEALAGLPGWRYDEAGRAIRRDFSFADFGEAFAFMARAALAAEKADHHPDWSNSWNKVAVALSTHSAGGVTAKDVALAKAMDGFASGLP
ncbi:MAG TPA: 4a-hydroxytetrahydrobiopterin dehydratase [Allosphingosinicella sp.]|nr:4a-hydroxytetrahydrobiopterin dehydratase [Allosphingosinicella sp.]